MGAEGISELDADVGSSPDRIGERGVRASSRVVTTPLALALGEPGSEIQAPMALVILTGLVTSTALDMVVVPALLATWGGSTEPVEEALV